MTKDKRDRYENERNSLKDNAASGDIAESDAERILEFADAKDEERLTVSDPVPDDNSKSDSTLARYVHQLKRASLLADFELTDSDTTADDINRLMDALHAGRVEGVKDDGLSKGTLKAYQGTLRKFYEYLRYSDHVATIDKADIQMFKPQPTSVDERDIFDTDDIKALRDTASAFGPRDKALVDLLLYTGQRKQALLSLRVKDVKPSEGIFYLNHEDGGLKGAQGKRPLLYAEKACREWKRAHPTGDPNDYFLTTKIDWGDGERQVGKKTIRSGDQLDPSTVHRQLHRIGEKAGVDKPVNAHNFRHTFVTLCKRDYELDDAYIKKLIGHRPDSDVMERTYQHLVDDDAINAAEIGADLREPEDKSSLTPGICDVCGEPLSSNAKACASCGTLITPDAASVKDRVDDDLWESKGTAEDIEDSVDVVSAYLRKNPEALAELLAKATA